MKLNSNHNTHGFTLVEIIVALTITAVLATMIVTYFGKAFSESVAPVSRLRAATALHRVMQNIMANYNVYPQWRSGTIYAANANVIPKNFNGHYYKCTAGTSGAAANEPVWPLNSGGTVVDNTITWTESGRLRTVLTLATLRTNIGAEGSDQLTNPYGKNPDGTTYTKYNVVKNGFVQFVSDAEVNDTSGANNILKVTLKSDTEETLTALFFSD
jgi:prepilin-type N-terminal cleavage/methylation domain-containing protein